MMLLVLGLAVFVGVALGLLGGGGSILTLPILTYVAGVEPRSAIASSLFVVAVTSATAVVTHARAGRVRWRTGLAFGLAGMTGAFTGGRLAAFIPAPVLMVAFAAMMLAAAIAMLRGRRERPGTTVARPLALVLVQGAAVGLITGMVGAGGGFVVVPALVVLGGLRMEQAVGTSLLVIAMQSVAGLAGHLGHVEVAWPLTLAVTAAAVVGSFVGGAAAGRVPPAALRRGFGVFVLLMAVVVLLQQALT